MKENEVDTNDMSSAAINWLLEGNNPAIKYRTQVELLKESADITESKAWILDKLPENWFDINGLWYRYYVTALAECGLTYKDIPSLMLDKAFLELDTVFDCGCGDFMLLTSLMKLGFSEHQVIRNIINTLSSHSLPDGGFLCLHRLDKMKYTPKSCYKVNLHALLFLAECRKADIDVSFGKPLIEYFLNRSLFYKNTDKQALVLDSREGWRTIDTFYPFEVMRVGLQNVVEAFSALGYGSDERLQESWKLLNEHTDHTGKVLLKGTMTKSYLPKERVGKVSKWVTFYTLLADKHRTQ